MNKRIKILFQKYLNDTCTREEFDEVFQYLAANQEDKELEKMLERRYDNEVAPAGRRPTMLPAIAAIMILVASTIAWMIFDSKSELSVKDNLVASSKISSTTNAELKYLLLPDSTQVWLNAASSLELFDNFGTGTREVRLSGEAYFDVQHAADLPFIIHTGSVRTEVLGTAFNIKAYPDLERITVSVKRGKVKVNYSQKEVATLVKGQQVSIGTKTSQVTKKLVKEEETAAWQNGNLVYDDYSLSDIVKDLGKVYNSKIRIADPGIAAMQISTVFKKEAGLQKALEILCSLTDTELVEESGSYIINNPK